MLSSLLRRVDSVRVYQVSRLVVLLLFVAKWRLRPEEITKKTLWHFVVDRGFVVSSSGCWDQFNKCVVKELGVCSNTSQGKVVDMANLVVSLLHFRDYSSEVLPVLLDLRREFLHFDVLLVQYFNRGSALGLFGALPSSGKGFDRLLVSSLSLVFGEGFDSSGNDLSDSVKDRLSSSVRGGLL